MKAEWVVGESPEGEIAVCGGDPSSPSWEDYAAQWKEPDLLEALREAATGLDLYGEDMDDGYFRLSDGRAIGFSWRGWGDFRQALENKREGYMTYYMRRLK